MAASRAHAIRHRDQLEALNRRHLDLDEAAALREHAESLLRGIDALTRKFSALGPLPLDVLDRAERILTAAHVANLLRVSRFPDSELAETDA